MKWKPVDNDADKPLENEMLWAQLANKANEDEGQTLLHCRYVSKHKYANGGWMNIDEDTYLENADTGEKLELFQAIGVPLAPDKHYFKKAGELKQFVLLFPRVPRFWKSFHLIEQGGAGSFRVRDIPRNDTGVYQIQLA